jgi:epoxyqueuosine reductase
MKLLLHACCGPCLIEPLDRLREGHVITVAYANPNIHPRPEYERRRDTAIGYAAAQGVPFIELPYEPAGWVRAVGPAAESESRCRACFLHRLGAVAAHAASEGFDAFATTLTVSPYQDAAALRDAAEEAAQKHGVHYLHTDFREAYADAVRRSRELGMYRQNYCGCLVSQVEAGRERAERKAERKARRLTVAAS